MATYSQNSKRSHFQLGIFYPATLSFKIEGEIKNYSDKQKLKKYSNTKSTLKETLKGFLQIGKEVRRYRTEEITTGQ